MTLALSWALVFGCASITEAELAARMDRDGDGDLAAQWGGADCDDNDPGRNDAATETCNGADDDCNGAIDDVQAPEGDTYFFDLDGDDVGGEAVQACDPPDGTVAKAGDCDDENALVHPGVAEVCNGFDDDCDGRVDDEDDLETQTWYGDADGDDYGLDTVQKIVSGCAPPHGFTGAGGDCDDLDAKVNPDATEICNERDDDCDGLSDADDDSLDGTLYYEDRDNDDFGSAYEDPIVECTRPLGYSADHTDCDDTEASVNPDAIEVCNGRDDNCADGEDDAVDQITWYFDEDEDGYGDDKLFLVTCDKPKGYVLKSGDCDDSDVRFNPGVVKCDSSTDWNCDGSSGDEDADGDGYDACDDCDDSDAAISPAADEVCDAADTDENCNELSDDDDESTQESGKTRWYPDDDGDLYGDSSDIGELACAAPPDTVSDHTDCDDTKAATHPGAVEVWYDGPDQNCDGESDFDFDGDGYDSTFMGAGLDCNDGNAAVYPGAKDHWYDGEDTDCDGADDYDKDGDGYKSETEYPGGTDCDDENGAINPGAAENTLTLTVDEDCDGNPLF